MQESVDPAVSRLLVGACGAINVVSLHEYLIALQEVAFRTTVVLTKQACALASAQSIRAITGSVVHTDEDHHGLAVPHMELARWADLLVVLPATANILGKAAHGIADDLLSSIILARTAPTMFVPSMSPAMWSNPAVRRNVELLKQDGHRLILSDTARPSRVAATGEWIMSELGPSPVEAARKIAIEAKAMDLHEKTAE